MEVVDVPERKRYEASDGGEVLGWAEYILAGPRIVLSHTEVRPEAEGRGVGSALAGEVFADVRRRRLEVVPTCPFMASYVQRHPELLDLITPALRSQVAPPG